ncbi:hypothetical protein Tco_1161273 [Tanacetum coccineum]
MDISPPAHTLTFTGVLSESSRIIKSNYSHFLTLSLLFLPLSTTLIITPTLRQFPNHPNFPPNHHPDFPPNHNNYPPIHHLVYILIIYTFTLCATSTITYNAHHIFSLSNALTSTPLTTLTTITTSLFPLAFTAVVSHALMFLASLTFLMLAGLAFKSVQTLALLFGLRFVVEYDSVYFTPFSAVLGVVLFVVMMWLYVNWLLVNVVVVTESKWGFQALVRSWYLVKGMRSVAVKLFVFYGVLEACLVLVYSRSVIGYGVGSWAFILNVVFGSGFLMLLMLQSCVANVVLYNYCKAIHGELVIDVGDYVGLSADDEKVPYVVTVVTA